jgi:hypothetical protein
MRQNRIAQRLQVMAPGLMSAAWGAGLRQAQRAPDKALAYLRRTLPAGDVAVIDRPEVAAVLRAAFARPVSRTAGRAAVAVAAALNIRWRCAGTSLWSHAHRGRGRGAATLPLRGR